MAQSTMLQKITKRTKQLQKASPKTTYRVLQKRAANELKKGGKRVSGVTKKVHKKPKKMAQKTRTVVVAGHHHRKPVKRRKARVSGLSKHIKFSVWDAVKMSVGGAIGGGVGAVIYRRAPGHEMVKGLVEAVAGIAGMVLIGPKHPIMFGIANGVSTGGGVNIMHSTGMIAGVDDMVAGLFDGMNGNTYEIENIPTNTAGNRHNKGGGRAGLHEGGYMGTMTNDEIDKWVAEGVPGMGGDDTGWR